MLLIGNNYRLRNSMRVRLDISGCFIYRDSLKVSHVNEYKDGKHVEYPSLDIIKEEERIWRHC